MQRKQAHALSIGHNGHLLRGVSYHSVVMPGAGSTSLVAPNAPPSGARVTGQIRLTQGTYLYNAVGQQSTPQTASGELDRWIQ